MEEQGEGDEDDVEGEEVAEARWGEEGGGEAEEDGGEVVEGEEEHGQDNELRQQRGPAVGGSHRWQSSQRPFCWRGFGRLGEAKQDDTATQDWTALYASSARAAELACRQWRTDSVGAHGTDSYFNQIARECFDTLGTRNHSLSVFLTEYSQFCGHAI